jgi:hypothetical protein
MGKVKRAKFKVKRVLSRRTGHQDYYIEMQEVGGFVSKPKMPVFYAKKKGIMYVPQIVWFRSLIQAKFAATWLNKKINRQLPSGPTTMDWVKREAEKLNDVIGGR